jgi:CubicO group peptidase (beta-lactamase class C family)
MVKRQIALTVLLFTAAVSTRADRLDDFVADQMKAQKITGAVVVVLQNGVIVEQRAYGLANIEFKVPMEVEDVFPIASITKVFTATAIFELVQDGRVRLGDRLSSVVPGLPSSWKDVTVLQCLNHTSGLPDLYENHLIPVAFTATEAIQKLADEPLLFKPGEKTRYNQTEFLLLRMLIEKVSGRTFDEFLAERIFRPAAMKTAQFADARDIVPRKVSLYSRLAPDPSRREFEKQNGKVVPSNQPKWIAPYLYPDSVRASAGLVMSALDLARFDTALTAKTLLNQSTLEMMWTPTELRNGSVGNFTAGWEFWKQGGIPFVGHAGGSGVEYARTKDGQYSVIVFTDSPDAIIRFLTVGVLHIIAAPIFPQLRDAPLPERLDCCAGKVTR